MASAEDISPALLGGRPELLALHVAPPSILLNTPANPFPAKTVEEAFGSMTMAPTDEVARPVLIGVQNFPPVVVLNAPPASVPAYNTSGARRSMARVTGMPPSGPPLVHSFSPAWGAPGSTNA